MSQENVEIVKRGKDAFNRRDVNVLAEAMRSWASSSMSSSQDLARPHVSRSRRCHRRKAAYSSGSGRVFVLNDHVRSNVSITLASYEQGIDAYLQDSLPIPVPAYAEFLRSVLTLLPASARMLELGSGPGHDARFFETHGVHVQRTDGARAFVERLRAYGHAADLLDVTTGDFGGPFDIVFANAVLLHLTAIQLAGVLAKSARAVGPEGLLAFTVKEGDGEAWSTAKIGRPRYFAYWREPALRTRLAATGWTPVNVTRVQGRSEPWLYFVCRQLAR
jgi:2-polyprenyl-3-methyl-5-hydroxy-6-metoxy-1,4-benzoquinol methylase